jgi:hypothetical protein
MKTYKGVEIQLHAFLTSTLDGGARPGFFNPEDKASGIHWIGDKKCSALVSTLV